MTLQHLRSSTANKRPDPTAMADGQIALNTAAASPGLFYKDSAGNLVKAGPVHVGSTAPNVSPASGGTAGNSTGESWLDTSGSNPLLKVWNGSSWQTVQPVASGTVVSTADTGSVTSTMIADGTIVNSDVNASAAIAGTKISPDFGSQNVTTTGTVTGASLNPTSSTVPTNGVYLPAANSVAISTGGSGRLFIDSSGRVGIGATPGGNYLLEAGSTASASARSFKLMTLTGGFSGGDYPYFGYNLRATGSSGVYNYDLNDVASAINFGPSISFSTAASGTAGNPITWNERLRITSAGLVGVGVSSPSARLEVGNSAGGVIANFTNLNNADFNIGCTSGVTTVGPAFGVLALKSNNTTAIHIDSSQRVGIGSSSPGYPLTVNGRISYAGAIGEGADTTLSSSSTTLIVGDSATWQNLALKTNGSNRVYINAAGSVGIGNTVPGNFNAAANNLVVGTGSGNEGITIYAGSDSQSRIDFKDSADTSETGILYYSHASDSMIVHTAGSERFRCDSSGRLLVGTSTSVGPFNSNLCVAGGSGRSINVAGFTNAPDGPVIYFSHSRSNSIGTQTAVQNGDDLGRILFYGTDGSNYLNGGGITCSVDGAPGTNDLPTRLSFSTCPDGSASPVERLRITNNGFLKISNDNSYTGIDTNTHGVRQGTGANWTWMTVNDTVDPFGIRVRYLGAAPNGTGNPFVSCADTAGARFEVRSNGGIANYSGNNVNLSDINSKKDISPAAGTWDCIKEWEIVNYRYKDQPDDADLNLGVIAQQVAESCPEVITVFEEAKDDQPEKLGVKEQQMYWMAIKALQEAQVRIETLEAEVAALKAQ